MDKFIYGGSGGKGDDKRGRMGQEGYVEGRERWIKDWGNEGESGRGEGGRRGMSRGEREVDKGLGE